MRNNITWLYLILIVLHSGFAYSFNTDEADIEQMLSQQIPVNPEAVFYKIEAFLADTELSLTLKSKLMVMQAEVAYIIDQPEHILKYSKSALATGLLKEPWHTRVLISQARGYFLRGQYKEFFATANMAVIQAEQSNLLNYKIAALVERANAYIFLADNIKATKDLNLAIKYLELLPNTFDKAIILEQFSVANKKLGKIEIAKKHQKQAIDIYKEIGSPHYLSIGYYNIGRIYQEVKDWQEASKWMLQSYRQALKDNNKLNQAFSLSRMSEYQNNLENFQQAKKYLNEAIIAADESNSERVKIHVRKNMANLLCQNKKFQECKTLLLDTIELANTYQMHGDKGELMQKLAETYYQLGAFETAYLTLKSANSL